MGPLTPPILFPEFCIVRPRAPLTVGSVQSMKVAFELAPDSLTAIQLMQHAVLKLQANDVEGYEEIAAQRLRRFAESSDALALSVVPRIYILDPRDTAAQETQIARSMADRLYRHNPFFWNSISKGIAELRCGNYTEAESLLQEGERTEFDLPKQTAGALLARNTGTSAQAGSPCIPLGQAGRTRASWS